MEIKKDENGNVIEPTAAEIMTELARVEEERDNYKKGLLERESKLKELKDNKELPEKEKEEEEDESQWDDASKKFQEETISKTKLAAEEVASGIVTKTIETANEKQAIADFREANPDITDEQWVQIVANYNPKNGKTNPKLIIKDLERANVLRKFDAGEKIDPAEIGRMQANDRLRDLNTGVGTGASGRYEEERRGISEGQISIGSRMRVTEEDLKKEDDSLSAEIKIA